MGASAPLSTLEVYINNQPLVQATKVGDQETKRLANSMRMLGRDILRLGGLVNKYGTWFSKAFNLMKESSLDLGGAMEDIQWAMEDIFATIGDAIAPIFEILADIAEQVADAFEAMPDSLKTIIGLFLVGGMIGLQLFRVFTDLYGSMLLLKGMFKGTSGEVSGLWNWLVKLNPFMKETASTSQALATIQQQMQVTEAQLALETSKWSESLLKGDIAANKHLKNIQNLQDQIKTMRVEQANLQKGEKSATKTTKKAGKGMTGWAATIGKTVAFMGVLAGLMLILSPIIELLAPIFESIGEALEVFFEPLEPIIDAIAEWIDENPELAASLLIGVVGALIALLALKTPIFGFLSGMLGKGTDVIGMADKGSVSFLKLAAAIAIIALSLVPLILAFKEFLVAMKQNNITIPEAIGYLFALGGAIIFIVGILIALGVILAPTLPLMAGLALILLAAGAAAMMFGAGILFAGMGVKFASEGLLQLVKYIPQVLALIPALFALSTAMGLLGAASVVFSIAGLGAMMSLLGIAAGFTVLAASILLVAAALRAIPEWARGFVGGIAGLFSGIFGAVPVLQEGGIVERGGIAYLEPAEVVTPAGGAAPGAGTIYATFHIEGTVREEADLDRIADAVIKKLQEQYETRSY